MPKQATRNKPAPTQPKAKGVIFLVSLLVGGLLLLVGFGTWYALKEGNSMNEEEKTFTQYLNEKYGKDFIVDNIKTTGGGLGVKGYRKGEAYPKDNKEVKFEVMYSEDTSEKADQYSDTYLTNLWSRDEATGIENILSSILEAFDYTIEIGVPHSIQTEIHGSTPTLQTMKAAHPGAISYGINVNVQGTFSDDEKQQHYTNAFQLVKFLQEKSDLDTRLIYSVYLSDLRTSRASRYECYLTREQISKIANEGELATCFTKRGVE